MFTSIFLYICLLAYMGLFAIMYDKYVTLLIFLVLLALPVVLFIQLLFMKSKVRIRLQERMGVIGKDEDIQVRVSVENVGLFPISDVVLRFSCQNAFSDEKIIQTVSFSLPGRRWFSKKDGVKLPVANSLRARTATSRHSSRTGEGNWKKHPVERGREIIFSGKNPKKEQTGRVVEKTLVLGAQYCGNILITCEQVRLFDFLHLTSIRKRPKRDAGVTVSVLPTIVETDLEQLPLAVKEDIFSLENDLFSKVKPGDDPSEIFDIREYRDGDRIHRIHWKLSSKRNQWMVKDFSLPMSYQIAVLLDLFLEDETKSVCEFMDELLGRALSVSHTLLLKGIAHDFVWVDGRDGQLYEIPLAKEDDFYEMLEKLLYAHPYKEENRNMFAEVYENTHPNKSIADHIYIAAESDLK